MKNTKALLLAVCAVLCLPACWCSKKKCDTKYSRETPAEVTTKKVALNDDSNYSIDAFDVNELILNEEFTAITSKDNGTLNKF